MTRLADRHGAVNLAQGYPDFPAPTLIKDAACRAIQDDVNQYSITWGATSLRQALAANYRRRYGMDLDPETQICVTCGSTEGMIAAILGLANPGDEIIVFEPFYENYAPDAKLAGATLRYVQLHPPHWDFDEAELRSAFSDRTRAIVINSPHNPTGKVFSRSELQVIAELCQSYDAIALADEIYEHIVYGGAVHIPIATIPGMAARTVTISSISKSYSVTGWRVGWTVASPELTNSIRKVHDFLTVGAPSPLQEAAAVALAMPDSYYDDLAAGYAKRRALMSQLLAAVGLPHELPQGAYYILADVRPLGWGDDLASARRLVETGRVAAVPGSSFYAKRGTCMGSGQLRFAFSKSLATLQQAGERLARLNRTAK
ncbi:MAG TPA: aminotransferase class I/II-fold pyridoxal phosphate-dependent enzyme [Candidatus Saccharimonadales bacterium]|nr:aminotransferase class I/II-fold pyridoxal phosphate-dependent enzyme [Candidatus Saccharimonadales bacterium]